MNEYAKVLKANPYGNNQYTKGGPKGGISGGEASTPKPEGKVAVEPSFKARTKLTIQTAAAALEKQGIKLEHAGMVNFSPLYKLTGKDGTTQTVGAKDLTRMLTKKSAFQF